ncbi:MAG: chorismate synthase [Deltaproteobacteria bacterium]|nr:MAG: chorismate synthase [Deltaproteobacteria bacterium]
MIRFTTAGESHGPGLVVVIEGIPANLLIRKEEIEKELRRRMKGFGRGGRMKIERDEPRFLSGVRKGLTLGTPIAIFIENRDFPNWEDIMSPFGDSIPGERIERSPRPGHADLSGVLKRNFGDVRNVLERASARETAARVAAGAVAKVFLRAIDVEIISYVCSIGPVKARRGRSFEEIGEADPDSHPLRMIDGKAEKEAMEHIREAARRGDSVGGSFEVVVRGLPPGLGDYDQWERRLDGRLGGALLSIPAIKGVEVGEGIRSTRRGGLKTHDPVYPGPGKSLFFGKYRLPYRRKTNRAGGLEGGMTNGEELRITCYMKPIPTLTTPLDTIDLITGEPVKAIRERSDVCAVPAAAVVGEAMVALVLSSAVREKFGGDAMEDFLRNYESYLERICGKRGEE